MKKSQLATYLQIALNFQAAEDGQLPEWLLLVPAGEFTGRDGRTFINDAPQLVIDFVLAKERDLVMDINHSSELKAPKGDEAPARGWFTELEIRDGAIWGHIDWNEVGKSLVLNREYRFYSPALLYDTKGRVRGIASVGLTNKHNLKQLVALNNEQSTTGENPMTLAQAIALALGLNAETATVDDAVTEINALKGKLQTALNSEGAIDLNKYVPREQYQLALNRAEESENKLADHGKAQLKAKAETLIDKAIEDGRAAPANREQYLALCHEEAGYKQVEELLGNAPKIIAEDSNLDGKKPAADRVALNSEQQAIDDMFGNTAEEVREHNQ